LRPRGKLRTYVAELSVCTSRASRPTRAASAPTAPTAVKSIATHPQPEPNAVGARAGEDEGGVGRWGGWYKTGVVR
jgi:hypothetical protein